MDNQQERPSDLDIGWLVGVIESEGCLTVQRARWRNGKLYYNTAVIISNTSKIMIERLANILTRLSVGHHVRWYSVEQLAKYNRRVKRPQANIIVWGVGRVTRLLDVLEGLWTVKAAQANVLRQFVKSARPFTGPTFDGLWAACHALNQGILTGHTSEPPTAA